jgi:hypothetical protein
LSVSGDLEHCAHVDSGCAGALVVDEEASGVAVLEFASLLSTSDGSAMVGVCT